MAFPHFGELESAMGRPTYEARRLALFYSIASSFSAPIAL